MQSYLYKYLLTGLSGILFLISLYTYPYDNSMGETNLLRIFSYLDKNKSNYLENKELEFLKLCGN
jgi:hypothetical protein